MLNADHLIVCSNTLATLGFQYRNHGHDTMPIPNLTPSEGETYDASQKPPPFGHALKHYFALDDDYVNLNHGMSRGGFGVLHSEAPALPHTNSSTDSNFAAGSYGSLPLPVIFAATRMGYEIERNPDLFHRLTFKPLLDKSRYVARPISRLSHEKKSETNARVRPSCM